MAKKRKRMEVACTGWESTPETPLSPDDNSEMGVAVLSDADLQTGTSPSQTSNDSDDWESPQTMIRKTLAMAKCPEEYNFSKKCLNRKTSVGGIDYFNQLADEEVLCIFKWLGRSNILNCALTCKRFRRLSYIDDFWTRITVADKRLSPDSVAHILQRGVKILRMSTSQVVQPMFKDLAPSMADYVSKVEYLDLSIAVIDPEDLAELLSKCVLLKKLSLEGCATNARACAAIANNTNLTVLNMSQCTQLVASSLSVIFLSVNLAELNLAWTGLCNESVNVVCKLVNEDIRQLNLSGCKTIVDSNVGDLIVRCTRLSSLDLSDCTELTHESVSLIVSHLADLEHLKLSRCYNIVPHSYLLLQDLPSLRYLDIFGLLQPAKLECVQNKMMRIRLNQHKYSTIARPTVGIRVTSIWGLRVRELD